MQDETKQTPKEVTDSPKFDISGLPNKQKELLIPPLGFTVAVPFTSKIPGQEGQRIALFKVTARNPGQLRFSAELQGFAPVPRPPAPPKGAGQSVDLEVQSGVLGGGTKFT